MIVKKTKYMEFELIERKSKTNIYEISNIKNGESLGIIEWYAYWRQYIFQPEYGFVLFNSDCLNEISKFLSELNKKHKEEK